LCSTLGPSPPCAALASDRRVHLHRLARGRFPEGEALADALGKLIPSIVTILVKDHRSKFKQAFLHTLQEMVAKLPSADFARMLNEETVGAMLTASSTGDNAQQTLAVQTLEVFIHVSPAAIFKGMSAALSASALLPERMRLNAAALLTPIITGSEVSLSLVVRPPVSKNRPPPRRRHPLR
jgi:hypothetical protein